MDTGSRIHGCFEGTTFHWINAFQTTRVVVIRVPQYTVLCPLLFSLYIISTDIESEIRVFADDSVCYLEIKEIEDAVKP